MRLPPGFHPDLQRYLFKRGDECLLWDTGHALTAGARVPKGGLAHFQENDANNGAPNDSESSSVRNLSSALRR